MVMVVTSQGVAYEIATEQELIAWLTASKATLPELLARLRSWPIPREA
jgi:hypothetical protein